MNLSVQVSIRSNLHIEIQQNFNRKRPGSRVVSSVKVTVTNFEGYSTQLGPNVCFSLMEGFFWVQCPN